MSSVSLATKKIFGSSVAEAQACGLPVIVGRTNGNADYLCSRDTHLADDRPETLASVFRDYAERKARGGDAWGIRWDRGRWRSGSLRSMR